MVLKYDLEKKNAKPVYESLYDAIKTDILKGRLRKGRKLPSKRDMAEDNGISLTTVMNAYQQLLMEGYLTSEEKKGYYVADIQAMDLVKDSPGDLVFTRRYVEDEWFADFRSNNTLYHYFPFSSWKKMIREVLTEYEIELVRRCNPYGLEDLRIQIAGYLQRNRGICVPPERIIIGAGIEYLYARLISLFPKNTVYAVEDPGYQKIPKIFESYDIRFEAVAMDESGVDPLILKKKKASIVHVTPEHAYPTGIIMPMQRRQEILSWAEEEEDRYIIEDDFDCEFRYNYRPVPALMSLDRSDRVIYMNTFSKTLSPAIRISYMVLPERLVQKYINETNFFTNSTSSLDQYALAKFIEKGYFERHINKMRKLYRREGEALREAICANHCIPASEVSDGSCGTHLLIKLDTDMDDDEIKKEAANRGINVAFLSDFCIEDRKGHEHTMILNFSDLDESTQIEAVRRLGEIFTD